MRLLEVPDDLLGALAAVPHTVTSPEAERLLIDPLLRWASPDIPEVSSDIYAARTTAADVARIAGRP